MKAKLNEIVKLDKVGKFSEPIDFGKIDEMARQEEMPSAEKDHIKVLLVGIDFQYCFFEKVGSLGVPGSRDDISRTIKWLYRNAHKVTRVMLSADDHTMKQIFFPCWWRDRDGNEADPNTVITHIAVASGVWIPNYDKLIPDEKDPSKMVSYCQEYVRHLEEQGNQELRIWPYHATSQTFDANIEAQLSAMVYYHGRCRQNDPFIARKGDDPWTEMYSLIKPEWSIDNYVNRPVLNEFCNYDVIVFTGEAASHCAGLTVYHTAENFATVPESCRPRIVVLRDCMSPIPGFEDYTENLYKTLENKYGVLVTRSTEFML